jgi:erythromycin esterase
VVFRVKISRRAMLTTAGAAAVIGGGWLGTEAFRRDRIEAGVLPWLQANAQPFDIARPDSIWTPALSRALAGARVIGLGEATHGSHEDAAVKAAIIKGLVSDGTIKALLLEVNAPGGRELDAFVHGGAGDPYERLRTAKVFRVVKTRALGDLLGWLRDWNRTAVSPVRIFGIDCQASAEDATTALEALRAKDPTVAAGLAARLRPIVSEEARKLRFPALIKSLTTAQLLESMAALEDLQAALERSSGDRDARYAARAAWQGLKAFELETSDGKIEGDVAAYYSRRDGFMADNVLNSPTDGAAALWAHNYHVAGGQAAGMTPTGGQLRRTLGDAYRAVVVEYGEARFNAVPAAPFGSSPDASKPTEVIHWKGLGGRLASILDKVGGEAFWISLRDLPKDDAASAWRNLPYRLDWPGYAATPWQAVSFSLSTPVHSLFDVVVFMKTMAPSRPV